MSDPKRILAFIDKWIGREMAHSMISQFPADDYVFVVGPNEQLRICELLTGYDVRCNSRPVIQELVPDNAVHLTGFSTSGVTICSARKTYPSLGIH